MAANEIIGSYQLYATGTNSNCYPTNGLTGAYTTTAASSMLADATRVIIDGVLFSPVSGATLTSDFTIKNAVGGGTIMALHAKAAANGPRYVAFGESGLELKNGFFATNSAPLNNDARVFFRVFQRTVSP